MTSGTEILGAGRQPLALVAVRVVGLALILWGLWSEVHPGETGAHLAAWVLAASLVPAFAGWTIRARIGRIHLAALFWLGLGGGAMVAMAPIGLAFVGTSTLSAASALELPAALGLAALGPAASAVAVAASGASAGLVLASGAAALAGLVLGAGRRQSVQRAAQSAMLAVEHERAEVERARAGVLAERNELAREVHDVLAHTLGALSVQIEALAAQLDFGTDPVTLADGIRRTRSLAAEGLVEARRAVQALREDSSPLGTQIERLGELRGIETAVVGERRRLSPEATLALYRVAQEAITNANKHAPGASVGVRLAFGAHQVTLSVENGPAAESTGELARTGSGYGLDGIRERVRLLGGEVTAGPKGRGWLVEATVPA